MAERIVSRDFEGKKPGEATAGGGGDPASSPPSSWSVYWNLAVEGAAAGLPASPGRERIGRYHLREVLGQGGMGVVYRAEQTEPVRRTVALKLIRGGFDTREIVGRFESERQALAIMNHPGIARVLDAGAAEDGSPYFVMEYVDGVPITVYCDQRRLATRARLELFVKVCDAIHHAHQKAVIHRDIKPSNVLVAEIDGAPQPKVIDFGIAKALGSSLTGGDTALTAAGQVIGTLEYMSPEQAASSGLDIDTRTDIYTLGVLLYELLTGVLPFAPEKLRQQGLAGLLRTICEEVPPKPSTRVRQLAVAGGGPAVAGEAKTLARARELRGDLDWITMKALEKDRRLRYGSASELAEDVRRHLAYEPVLAGPPSALYRLRKLVRRHREKFLAGAVLAVLLVGLVAVWYRLAITTARDLWERGMVSVQEIEAIRAKQKMALGHLHAVGIPDWLPVWERGEESELSAQLAELDRLVIERHSDALACFEQAEQAAPFGSNEVRLVALAKEALNWRFLQIAEESGQVDLSPDFFRRRIESLRLGTYAEALKGNGEALIATDPPGAEVFCFRFEEIERRLVPLPFNPSLGLEDPARGLAGQPFLRVERVWGQKAAPFQAGDRLLRLGGAEARTLGEFARALANVAADAPVSVDVERGGDSHRFEWTPFPAAFYAEREVLKPGTVHDLRFQFDLTFEGCPLETIEGARAGVTPLKVLVPKGSYLFLLRKEGYADVRVPFVAPMGTSPPTIRLWKKEDVPEGFIPVPAGEFPYGGDKQAYEGLPRERVTLGDFFIARGEVTFGEYLEFVNDREARGDLDEQGQSVFKAEWESPELHHFLTQTLPYRDRIPLLPQISLSGPPHFPRSESGGGYRLPNEEDREKAVVGISMHAAVEYAHWLTERKGRRWRFRLPRDLEWEKAARGADCRLHVWGNDLLWSFGMLGRSWLPYRGMNPVIEPRFAYPCDESAYGVRDLAGSAAEPTTEKALPSKQFFVYRGGYWSATDSRDVHAASRNRTLPWRQYHNLGIRLVAEPPR